MKYLKYFEQASAYEAYKNGSDYVLPNVSFVVETKGVSYEPKIEVGKYKIGVFSKKDISGLTYNKVDLGLPSGTLWADRNVGATSPEDYGAAFAWGDTEGCCIEKKSFTDEETCSILNPFLDPELGFELTPDNIDEIMAMAIGCTIEDLIAIDYDLYSLGVIVVLPEKSFSSDWSDYFDTTDGGSTFNKYNFNGGFTVLQPEDDAATINMGSNWRMPTQTEMDELKQYCDYEVDVYDIKPRKFTSKINGNSITIPAPITITDSYPYIDDSYYRVWSSELYDRNDTARTCLIYNSSAGGRVEYRCVGLPVRGVCSK